MPDAVAFIPYHVPEPSRRPTSVLVLGVVGIVLASLAICTVILAVTMVIVARLYPSFAAAVAASDEEMTWLLVQSGADLIFHAALLWVCIAAIRLRPWARLGMLRWACAYLAWLAVDTTVSAAWVVPASLAAAGAATPPLATAPSVAATPSEAFVEYVQLGILMLLGAVYPVFVLVFMRKPHVRQAFEDPAVSVGGATA